MTVLPSTRLKKQAYHHTFALRKEGVGEVARHTLLFNPEDLSYDEPSKTTVTETLGGGYIADFGSAFKTVTLQGVTGYKARRNTEGVQRDGYTEFMHLRNKIYRTYIESADPKLSMYWYNWEDDDFWRIQPLNFRLLRNKNEPLLYRYEISFKLLQQLTSGHNPPKPTTTYVNNLVKAGAVISSRISSFSEVRSKF